MMNIILVGMKNAGKTTLGIMLSRYFDFSFIDVDSLIEKSFQKRTGQKITCKEIYQKYGNEYFRELEGLAVLSIVKTDECVIACGGGVVLRDKNMKHFRSLGKVVFLNIPKAVLWERTKNIDEHSDFVGLNEPYEMFEKMYEERFGLYNSNADLIINISNHSVKETFDAIVEQLGGG